MDVTLQWLGHASLLLRGEKKVIVDPWKLQNPETADVALVTHAHFDHCSPEDLRKVVGDATALIAPADAAAQLDMKARPIKPGQTITVAGVVIEAVPAYNVNKKFHPKQNAWVGYVITLGGKRIYVAGDTDRTPEMDGVKADVACLPVGGTYTMTAEEAAGAANAIQPKLAIPIHFGDIVGATSDAEKFRKLCRVPVKVLKPGEIVTLK